MGSWRSGIGVILCNASISNGVAAGLSLLAGGSVVEQKSLSQYASISIVAPGVQRSWQAISEFATSNPDSSAIQRIFPAKISWLHLSYASVSTVLPRFCVTARSQFQGKHFAFVWCKNLGSFSTARQFRKAGTTGRNLPQYFSCLLSKHSHTV